jgi:hypothetical protein
MARQLYRRSVLTTLRHSARRPWKGIAGISRRGRRRRRRAWRAMAGNGGQWRDAAAQWPSRLATSALSWIRVSAHRCEGTCPQAEGQVRIICRQFLQICAFLSLNSYAIRVSC